MGIFGTLFGSSKKKNNSIPEEFADWVRKSITLLGTNGEKENKEITDCLVDNGIPEIEAIEIVIFLPTAFCRKLLPELKWHNEYVDYYSETKKLTRYYTENARYQIMERETNSYWNDKPNRDIILNVAGRSAEFHVLNDLLNDGGKLEDVKLTPSYVLRYE